MRTLYPLQDSSETLENTVVAIGVFDGVHRGHQEILKQTVREARSQGLTPIVLTFDIHPTETVRAGSIAALYRHLEAANRAD